MEIRCNRFLLRPWRPGDEAALARHANNYKIWRNVRDLFPHPYTLQDARWWVRNANLTDATTNFAIVIETMAGQEAIGGIGLLLKDDIYRRSAEIGYWLGEAYWGLGLMTESVRAVTEYAFENFDLRRIYAGVLEWNPASMKVLEKAGYTLEARLRQAVTKEGQTMDEMIYAMTIESLDKIQN